MTLTDFLLARIAEDEEMWTMARDGGMVVTVNDQSAIPPQSWTERQLAECEAKRQIVNVMQAFESVIGNQSNERTIGSLNGLRIAVKELALPYADHPDYRDEWRP